ncbi:hypothetical protein D3C77_311860 [compost metagenome]
MTFEGALDRRAHLFGLEIPHRGLEESQVGGRVGEDPVVVGGAQQGVGQRGSVARRGRLDGVFKGGAGVGDLAVQLDLGDAELHQAALLLLDGLQGALQAAGVEVGGDAAEVERLEQGRPADAGADEGRIVGPSQFAQAAIQNGQAQVLQQVVVTLGRRVRVQIGIADPVQLDRGLHARLDQDAGLGLARGDLSQIGLGTVGGLGRPVREGRLDLGFHLIDVEVADRDHRRAFGAVIGLVELDEALARRGADDAQVADRQAVRQALAGRQQGDLGLERAQGRGVAQALLPLDHAALGVDVLGLHQGFGDLFAHDPQRGVDGLVVGARQLQHIGGLVEAGEGVGVGAEGQAETFQNAQQFVLGHIGRAVEGHVLHEVGQAQLVVVLHQRAGGDPQAQRRLARRRGVLQDGVAHAVGQDAEADGCIGGNVAGRLGPRLGRLQRGRGVLRRDGRRRRQGDGGKRRAAHQGQAGGGEQEQAARGSHSVESPWRASGRPPGLIAALHTMTGAEPIGPAPVYGDKRT